MLQITPHHHIHIAIKAVDFRKQLNGLKVYCEQTLLLDPFSGHVFAFRNNDRTAVKLLIYDGNGFWCCHKRFSKGRLSWWPSATSPVVPLSSAQLQIVLQQGDPLAAELPSDWLHVTSNPTALMSPDMSRATTPRAVVEPTSHACEWLPNNPRG